MAILSLFKREWFDFQFTHHVLGDMTEHSGLVHDVFRQLFDQSAAFGRIVDPVEFVPVPVQRRLDGEL